MYILRRDLTKIPDAMYLITNILIQKKPHELTEYEPTEEEQKVLDSTPKTEEEKAAKQKKVLSIRSKKTAYTKKARHLYELTDKEKIVLMIISTLGAHVDGKSYGYISMGSLKEALGLEKRQVQNIMKSLRDKGILREVDKDFARKTIPGYNKTNMPGRESTPYEIDWDTILKMLVRKDLIEKKFLYDKEKGGNQGKLRVFIKESSPDSDKSEEEQERNQVATDYPQHSTSPQFVANQDVARKVMRGKITVSEAIEKLAEQGISPDIFAWANITGDGSEEVQEVEKNLTEHRKRAERSEESIPDKEEIVTFNYKDSERQKLTDTEKKKYSELAKEHEEYKDFDTFDSNIEAMAKLLAHHDDDEKELMEAAEKRKRNLIVTGSYIPPMWKNILSKNNAWKIERGKFKKLNYLEEDDSPIGISDAEHNWVQ